MTEVSKASSLLRAERRPSEVVNELEARVAAVVRPFSLTLLRISLGAVFIWFGLLKVADVTPVGDLVAGTVPGSIGPGSFPRWARWRRFSAWRCWSAGC